MDTVPAIVSGAVPPKGRSAKRRAVIRYLNDQESMRERTVKAALDKIRVFYLAAVPETRYPVGAW